MTAAANTATAQILLLSHYNTGWVAFDDVLLTRVGQETVIKRSSYGIAGQVVATRVTGDPVSGNNGLFYIYSDHLGSSSLLVNSSNNPAAVPGTCPSAATALAAPPHRPATAVTSPASAKTWSWRQYAAHNAAGIRTNTISAKILKIRFLLL